MPFDGHLLADRGRVARELALPERVADDDARRSAPTAIILAREHAPGERRHTEDIEVIAADPHTARVASLASARDVECPAPPRENARKCVLPISKCFPYRIRQRRIR